MANFVIPFKIHLKCIFLYIEYNKNVLSVESKS